MRYRERDKKTVDSAFVFEVAATLFQGPKFGTKDDPYERRHDR